MVLEKNQIEYLFLWVHPHWTPVTPSIQRDWLRLIEVLEFEPQIGLLQTSPNYDSLEQKHIQELFEIEKIAKEKLEDRYHKWPLGNFVYSRKREHLEILKKLFNIETRSIIREDGDNCYPSWPTLFSGVTCFGIYPTVCVEHQCSYLNAEMSYYNQGLYSYEAFTSLPRHGIPSNKKSLEIMKRSKFFSNENIISLEKRIIS
jgi:hypothetical protein